MGGLGLPATALPAGPGQVQSLGFSHGAGEGPPRRRPARGGARLLWIPRQSWPHTSRAHVEEMISAQLYHFLLVELQHVDTDRHLCSEAAGTFTAGQWAD